MIKEMRFVFKGSNSSIRRICYRTEESHSTTTRTNSKRILDANCSWTRLHSPLQIRESEEVL